MKSPFARLFVALGATAFAASAVAAAPPPAVRPRLPVLSRWQREQQAKFNNSAPADEYFGKLKLSFLGMNNIFRDSAISSGDHTTDPAIINKVAFAEDALEAWAAKYPNDPQLARTYYLATQVDRKIWTKANQDRAWIFLNRLVDHFPGTYFANVIRRDLAIGFTEHYYAPADACATPAPAPSPTPFVAETPTVVIPTPEPAPTDPPTASPTPSPMATTIAAGPAKHCVRAAMHTGALALTLCVAVAVCIALAVSIALAVRIAGARCFCNVRPGGQASVKNRR